MLKHVKVRPDTQHTPAGFLARHAQAVRDPVAVGSTLLCAAVHGHQHLLQQRAARGGGGAQRICLTNCLHHLCVCNTSNMSDSMM